MLTTAYTYYYKQTIFKMLNKYVVNESDESGGQPDILLVNVWLLERVMAGAALLSTQPQLSTTGSISKLPNVFFLRVR